MDREQINTIIRNYVQGKLDEFDLEQTTSKPGNQSKIRNVFENEL